MEEHT